MKLTNISKSIENKNILKEIDFSLNLNEIIGLIGRNGSGKTTLFRTISGQYTLDSGTIMIDGIDLANAPEKRSDIFYIDEKENFLNAYSLKKSIKYTSILIQNSIKICF